ncbi:DUF2846 domain-containing protein [Niabella aurantiaca]|uniref:DUF2846 domain-containing protein n=1 Tax=Niabella aurantiaca TaxID=379900 RepID=UPI000382934E|nr:DUF2846 domain-containing protein [Niabella aurantiaca]
MRIYLSKMHPLIMLLLIGPVLAMTVNAGVVWQARDTANEILVFEVNKKIPATAKTIGQFKIGDKGFTTDCQYQRVIEKAQEKARKAGGNAIQITELKEPDIWSSCYRIRGNILFIEDIDSLSQVTAAVVSTPVPGSDTATYATIYFYRPKNFTGSAIGYNINLDDSVVWRAVNNSRYEIRVYKEGKQKIWAKTEAKAIIPLSIQFGRSYYIKCSIAMGMWVGQPSLDLIDPEQGRPEYERVSSRARK